ncbi:MFS transporter [Desulfovibrio cuneatus]|uniref:MFS transporter n=1 Tax=Desulfovibrio cuneatus TaxID=159728 RepID=UPI000428C208|nr:MFS transporter [Desulfovibrio cuneatus]
MSTMENGAVGSATAAGRKPNNYFDGLAVTGMHKAVFFILMLAYFFEQMDNWNFGFIAPAVFASWGLDKAASNQAMASIIFWYFIGMTSGGFLGGIISDIIGRRKTFLIAIVMFSSCSVINGLPIASFELFVASRALTGFGVFCLMVCSQAYIAEMSPAESRGKWQGLVAAVGFMAVPVIAFLCRIIVPLSPQAWRLIFYIGGTGMFGFFLALKYLPESPRWLVAQGRLAEAEAVVQRVTHQNIDLSAMAKNVPAPTNAGRNMLDMLSPAYIKRTVVLFMVFVTTVPAGFMFTSWTGKLLASIPQLDPITKAPMADAAGKALMVYDQATMLTIMTIISCGVPAGCYLASVIADKGGRKIPIMCCLGLSALCAYLFGVFAEHVYFVALCGFLLSVFNMAISFMVFSYTAESYPTRMRNTATGTHNAVARLSVSGSNLLIPTILATFGGAVNGINYDIPALFNSAAVLFAAPILIIAFMGERTGGRSLEDIK